MAVQRSAARAPGRHFLRSSRLAHRLVDDAGIENGDLVVEIGAGAGVLTRALAAAGAQVIALEVDPALSATLRRRFDRTSRVRIVQADALAWRSPDRPYSVVANLPFARSGAILGRLFGDPRRGPERADVIVQWEFAAKHAAVWPATLEATCWRAWYDVSIAGRLSRGSFAPPPSVDAAVLRFARRLRPLVSPDDYDSYRRFLSLGFGRPGQLQRAVAPRLSPLDLKRLAPVLGFDHRARARDLDARQWAELFAHARKGRAPR